MRIPTWVRIYLYVLKKKCGIIDNKTTLHKRSDDPNVSNYKIPVRHSRRSISNTEKHGIKSPNLQVLNNSNETIDWLIDLCKNTINGKQKWYTATTEFKLGKITSII